jgi:CheY-like chemotaxis protein
MVVDDEPALREATAETLRHGGWDVVEAASATEAVRMHRQIANLAVVLADVVMPGENTSELMATLRAESPGVQVVFMSGYDRRALVSRGLIGEGERFLGKPFTTQELYRQMQGAGQLTDARDFR